MTKPYYGTKKLPVGYRYATMEEAAKAGQVRRYGQFLIDPQILTSKVTVSGPKLQDYRTKLFRARGEAAGILHRYKLAMTENTKKKLKMEYEVAVEKVKKAQKEYDDLKSRQGEQQELVATLDPKKERAYKRQPKKSKVVKRTVSKKKAIPIRK